MEEIRVGEYVRSKDGIIAKVTRIDNLLLDTDMEIYDIGGLNMMEIPIEEVESYIIKHSPDIIDLIEVGDYVNGYRVVDITIARHKPSSGVEIDCSGESEDAYLWVDEIKSIVTKEQFESMKYVVGGKEE